MALATIPEASSSDSDDPCADDYSDSSGRPEMRYDGPGYFPRDASLNYYGDIDGVARWERATVYDPDDGAGGSDDGADDADGSGADDDDVAGPHDDAAYAAGSFVADDDARRATLPNRAGIPRTCHFSGETAPSGKSFFAHHLTAAYECPNAPAHTLGAGAAGATPIGASVCGLWGFRRARRRQPQGGARSFLGFGSCVIFNVIALETLSSSRLTSLIYQVTSVVQLKLLPTMV